MMIYTAHPKMNSLWLAAANMIKQSDNIHKGHVIKNKIFKQTEWLLFLSLFLFFRNVWTHISFYLEI